MRELEGVQEILCVKSQVFASIAIMMRKSAKEMKRREREERREKSDRVARCKLFLGIL